MHDFLLSFFFFNQSLYLLFLLWSEPVILLSTCSYVQKHWFQEMCKCFDLARNTYFIRFRSLFQACLPVSLVKAILNWKKNWNKNDRYIANDFNATLVLLHVIVTVDKECCSSQLGRQWVPLWLFIHTKLACFSSKMRYYKLFISGNWIKGGKWLWHIKMPCFSHIDLPHKCPFLTPERMLGVCMLGSELLVCYIINRGKLKNTDACTPVSITYM